VTSPHKREMDANARYQQAHGEYLRQVKDQFNLSMTVMMLWVVILGAVFFAQDVQFSTRDFAIAPQTVGGLIGILTAPLLHGSFEHLASNAFAFLILGTLAGSLYPRASLRAWPILWLGSGLGTWFISIGGNHIGASGITVGLMFFLIGQGLKRRDRTSLVALMLALFFFGGMVLSVLPREQGISWEYHLSGAVFGLLTGLLFSHLDTQAPKRLYSWDIEEEIADSEVAAELEPTRPKDVPVLWHRHAPGPDGKVLEFRRRGD
jgi:membrane associated rhomboid family serine protease